MILNMRADIQNKFYRPRSDCSWRSSLTWIYTVCHSVCILRRHYCMAKPHTSNLRIFFFFFFQIFTLIQTLRVYFRRKTSQTRAVCRSAVRLWSRKWWRTWLQGGRHHYFNKSDRWKLVWGIHPWSNRIFSNKLCKSYCQLTLTNFYLDFIFVLIVKCHC